MQAALKPGCLDLLEVWGLQVLNLVVVDLLLIVHLLPPKFELRAGLVTFDVHPELVDATADMAEADIGMNLESLNFFAILAQESLPRTFVERVR